MSRNGIGSGKCLFIHVKYAQFALCHGLEGSWCRCYEVHCLFIYEANAYVNIVQLIAQFAQYASVFLSFIIFLKCSRWPKG